MNSLLRGNALLALAAAALWGGGDFSGGMGVKRAGGGVRAALRVVLLSHVTSLAVLVADCAGARRCVSAGRAAGVGHWRRRGGRAGADVLLSGAVARRDGCFGGGERAAGGGDSGGADAVAGGFAGAAGRCLGLPWRGWRSG